MKLKYVARFIAGGTPDTTDADMWGAEGAGTPWVAIGDMSGSRVVSSTARSLSSEGLNARRLVPSAPGTVLFAMYASVGEVATLGVSAVWNQAILGVVPIEGRADGRFVAYWLRHFASEARSRANAATQANLGADQVANFPFPGFSLDEQRRIADFLDDRVARIDQIIAARRTQAELMTAAFQAQLTELTTPDDSREWRLYKFSRVAKVNLGLVDPRHQEHSQLPLIAPNHIEKATGRLLSLTSADEQGAESGKGLVYPGQVVYSKIRPALRKATVTPCLALCSADCYGIEPRGPLVDVHFLVATILGNFFTQQVMEVSERVAMPKVNRDSLNEVRVWVPGPVRQAVAGSKLTESQLALERQQDVLGQLVDRLEEYKQSLVTAAVTGEFDVTAASTRIPGE